MEVGELSQEQPPYPSLEDSVKEDISKSLSDKNMHFRFKVVEDVMAPLIHKVTSLTEMEPGSNEQGQRINPVKLVQLVDKAVMNLIVVGEDIATENPDYKNDIFLACEDVRSKGEILHEEAVVFIRDTGRRATMVHAVREVLFSVTRLMVIADTIDVNNLLHASEKIGEKLRKLQEVKSETELMDKIQDCTSDITRITQFITLRQNETKSKTSLQLLAAAQTELNQASVMLISASKAFLHNPTEKAAGENREFIIEGMLKSLRILSLLANGEEPESDITNTKPGELATRFTNFERNLDRFGSDSKYSHKVSNSLQRDLDSILKTASEFAASSSTRDYRQHTIITQSSSLKSGLQCLIDASSRNHSEEDREESMALTRQYSISLKRELHRVSVDHVSDAYVDAFTPMKDLVKAAQDGKRAKVDEVADSFGEHAKRMLKAAFISCSLSKDVDGIQMVRMAAKHINTLIPQVIRASQTLVAQPASSILKKNMSIFREAWVENVALLTSSVDAISPLIDFMIITEAHLREDGYVLEEAVEGKDRMTFDQTVHLVRGRCSRLAHVVKTEMKENPTRYLAEQRERITTKVHRMESKSLMLFHDSALKAREKINDQQTDIECLGALEKVVVDVRDLCREILITKSPEEQERVGSNLDDLLHPPRPLTPTPSILSSVSSLRSSTPTRKFQRTPCHSTVFDAGDSSKDIISQLSTEQQAQLAQVTKGLTAQQAEFESAAKDWDTENDIVLMAKEMCMMMMDMSNFTQGVGPLHTIMDLVVTAKDIARAGEYLCTLARVIADQCPDMEFKNDLSAYVERIKLYCHQLKITSAVKADSKNSTNETVDSASALMIAAKNLMIAVVDTVKTSYIASTAIVRMHGGTMTDQFTQWRLTVPRKKNLGSTPNSGDKMSAPIHQLGQFKPGRQKGRQLH